MGWVKVNSQNPCPVCEHKRWCSVTEDGAAVHCMRVQSQKSCAGGGWIHFFKDDPLPVANLPKRNSRNKYPSDHWVKLAHRMFHDCRADGMRKSLADSLGVDRIILEELLVGVGWDNYRKTSFSSWPEKNAIGEVVGIIRRYGNGDKRTMRHSSHGLYYVDGWRNMDGPLYIVEGGSDTAAMLSWGHRVIGRPSNLAGLRYLLGVIRGCGKGRFNGTIVVVAERDEKPDKRGHHKQCKKCCTGCLICWPGLYGAKVMAQQLAAGLRRDVHWSLPPDEAKDVRAWFNSRRRRRSVLSRSYIIFENAMARVGRKEKGVCKWIR